MHFWGKVISGNSSLSNKNNFKIQNKIKLVGNLSNEYEWIIRSLKSFLGRIKTNLSIIIHASLFVPSHKYYRSGECLDSTNRLKQNKDRTKS